MIQMISLLGAITLLAAFALQQMGRLQPDAKAYLWANLLGSATLAAVAWVERQWGFLLMESVWALVSAGGLWKTLRR